MNQFIVVGRVTGVSERKIITLITSLTNSTVKIHLPEYFSNVEQIKNIKVQEIIGVKGHIENKNDRMTLIAEKITLLDGSGN